WGTLFEEGLARKERFGETGELLILDPRKGRLLAAGRGSADAPPEELFRRIGASSATRGVFSYEHPQTRRRYLAGWATESGFGSYQGQRLVAVAEQEESEALAAVGTLLRQFTVLGLVS